MPLTASSPAGLLSPNDVLRAMYASRTVRDTAGREYRLIAHIPPAAANALYRVVRRRRPELVLEIGCAYGAATLSILTALEENGIGRLISIDIEQSTAWKNIGVENARRAGLGHRHTLVEAPSHAALPALLGEGTRAAMACIDGWHTFDYTLVDFFYCDKMLGVGGVIGFSDCGYHSVRRVLGFVCTHRKYRQFDAGLARDYAGRNWAVSLARRLLGWSCEDRYFEKLADWEPSWNYYRHF